MESTVTSNVSQRAYFQHLSSEFYVATTSWNTRELLELFLHHYRSLGFKHVLIMDYESTDGTRELLTSSMWADFVTVFPFPGLANLDSSNMFLDYARRCLPASSYVLFCDPDEFLVTPHMNIVRDQSLLMSGISGLSIVPRFNMTARREVVSQMTSCADAMSHLVYKVAKPVRRRPKVEMNLDALDPAYVFSYIPGKVLVSPVTTNSIGNGDHTAATISQDDEHIPDSIYLLHYQFRSWREFASKIELNKRDFGANPHLPEVYGWQSKRWMRLLESGRLFEEYLTQFPQADVLDQLISDGVIVEEKLLWERKHDLPRIELSKGRRQAAVSAV